MTVNIEIEPSNSNRYEDRNFNKEPIIEARFKLFMKEIDKFINYSNNLRNINSILFTFVYDELCMIINSDLIDFSTSDEKIKSLVEIYEASMYNTYQKYNSRYSRLDDDSQKVLEKIYLSLYDMLKYMKFLYAKDKHCIGKLRGIIMEALCISLYGNVSNFKSNEFVWDFNAYENGEMIKVSQRQTSDIYFESINNSMITEIKCRPNSIDEGQVDFINHLADRILDVEKFKSCKIILHGGTADDYNYLNIDFRDKLEEYLIYCKKDIDKLLEIF